MAVGCVLVMAIAGCGDSGRPKLVPVSGRVTWQGKPVQGAVVIFRTSGSPRVSSGQTDADGRFRLTTFDPNDGAPPGEHTITVTKKKASADSGPIDLDNPSEDYTRMMEAAASNAASTADDELPVKYSDPNQSGLTRSVVEGETNEFTFDLE